jgi:hypothetical protein
MWRLQKQSEVGLIHRPHRVDEVSKKKHSDTRGYDRKSLDYKYVP